MRRYSTCEYEHTLKKSGFKVDFKYTKSQRQKTKNRFRNIIWFNPPFNKEVSTNVAKNFLRLINRHFPKSQILHKIFNRNSECQLQLYAKYIQYIQRA